MKSVKPGRGPSAMGVWGAVVVVIGGIFWTIMAANMGAPVFFPIFGILFVITGIMIGVYHYKNATGKNRYSAFDVVDTSQEPDPLAKQFDIQPSPDTPEEGQVPWEDVAGFCPYCGAPAQSDFQFCRRCGKQLP